MTKSLMKTAFLSVNVLILILYQLSIIGLLFPQTLICMRHPEGYLKVNNVNTKELW